MRNDEVVVEVTVTGNRLRLFRKSGVVRCNPRDRRLSMEWDTRFDLRRVLGGTERTVLGDFYGIDPSTNKFVDAHGEEIDLSK